MISKCAWCPYLAMALALAAAAISYQLFAKHVTGTAGPAWFEAGCSDKAEDGGGNCAAVLASPYSYFPPKTSDKSDGRPHFPVAFLGFVYYSTLLVWLIGVGAPARRRRRLHWFPLVVVGLGLAGSIHYTRIMFSVLDHWCPWCLATHVLNLLIAGCLVFMWPRVPKSARIAKMQDKAEAESARSPTASHPSPRLLMTTVLAVCITMFASFSLYGQKTYKRQALAHAANFKRCVEAVKRITADVPKLVRNWQLADKQELAIGSDDTVRSEAGPDDPTFDLVLFSDFECPSCKRFAVFLEQEVRPLFGNRLRISFKHCPLDQACNNRASRTIHAHACEAAILAEAARIEGGGDAFWRTHDYLFEHRDDLIQGRLTPERLADALGMDPEALRTSMQSQRVLERIHADIELALVCRVRSTPAVFAEGRRVDALAVNEIAFWNSLAEMYWKRTGTPRPEGTKLPRTRTTPDNPSPKGAP